MALSLMGTGTAVALPLPFSDTASVIAVALPLALQRIVALHKHVETTSLMNIRITSATEEKKFSDRPR